MPPLFPSFLSLLIPINLILSAPFPPSLPYHFCFLNFLSSLSFFNSTFHHFHLLVPALHSLRAVSTQKHFLPPWSQKQPNQTPSNSFWLPFLLLDTDRSAAVCFPASVNYVTQLYHHRADAGKLN